MAEIKEKKTIGVFEVLLFDVGVVATSGREFTRDA
jgi:hypothetical protein